MERKELAGLALDEGAGDLEYISERTRAVFERRSRLSEASGIVNGIVQKRE